MGSEEALFMTNNHGDYGARYLASQKLERRHIEHIEKRVQDDEIDDSPTFQLADCPAFPAI